MKLPDPVYNVAKWVMFLGVPVATFIIGIIAAAQTGDPASIITAVFGGLSTLAGIVIKISDNTYKKELEEGGAK